MRVYCTLLICIESVKGGGVTRNNKAVPRCRWFRLGGLCSPWGLRGAAPETVDSSRHDWSTRAVNPGKELRLQVRKVGPGSSLPRASGESFPGTLRASDSRRA